MSPAPSRPPGGQPSEEARGKAVVMGLGLFGGGVAAARHLAALGYQVLVTDLRDAEQLAPSVSALSAVEGAISFRLGEHREADFEHAELVVANPAVSPQNPFLRAAQRGGARITSELELALDRANGLRMALVTGTQGKTSTTTFLAALLSAAGVPARLAGNMGRPLLEEVESVQPGEVLCIEVSSYQLEALPPRARAGVEAALVTNVLSDHLERHGTVEAYSRAKARILSLVEPGGLAVVPAVWAERSEARAAMVAGLPQDASPRRLEPHPPSPPKGTSLELDGCTFDLTPLEALPAFQRTNVVLALRGALALGADAAALQAALPTLRTPQHRAEPHTIAGRHVIDNGVCTTPDAALAVVAALPRGCTVLLGGKRKEGLSFTELADRLVQGDHRSHLFGEDRLSIQTELAERGAMAEPHASFDAAIAAAWRATPPDGVLLFSPACASFDTHRNFRERALDFLTRVRAHGAG